eukprot:585631-Pyramimonas_sp.AAC.1
MATQASPVGQPVKGEQARARPSARPARRGRGPQPDPPQCSRQPQRRGAGGGQDRLLVAPCSGQCSCVAGRGAARTGRGTQLAQRGTG